MTKVKVSGAEDGAGVVGEEVAEGGDELHDTRADESASGKCGVSNLRAG
jgi:hypothetical protein